MARIVNLGNIIAQINGSKILNITATAPVVWSQNGSNAVISVNRATAAADGLMSSSDKTKLDSIASSAVSLGETSDTAYRGDRGKVAYDHSNVVTGNPHRVTQAEVGLGNVPNVSTNDQTPTYSTATTLTSLTSGEKLSVSLGKLSKVTDTVISHTGDTVVHVTAAERGTWNNKVDKVSGKELSTNDFTDDLKTKLDGIEPGAQVNEVTVSDHGAAAGAIILLSKEVEELKKYCSYLQDKIEILTSDANITNPKGYVEGTKGFGFIDDPGTSQQTAVKIKVDPVLANSNLYIQCICVPSTGVPSITQTTLDANLVDQYGYGTLNGSLTYTPNSKCYFFVSTNSYVWNSSTSSNTITANNGAFGVDGFPVNGVDFKLEYYRASRPQDMPTSLQMTKTVYGYNDALALLGYAPTYERYNSAEDAITGFNNGDTVVIEDNWSLDYYLHTSLWTGNRFVRVTSEPPITSYTGSYYKETIAPAV